MHKTHLYAHALWAVRQKQPLLTRTVRVVLYAHLIKYGEERGLRVMHAGGAADHMHVLIHLHAAQNLAQMVRQLKAESSEWLNATRLLNAPFVWEDDYSAWSVSPTVLRQVMEYFDKQEEYHRTRTLDQELEQFARLQTGQ